MTAAPELGGVNPTQEQLLELTAFRGDGPVQMLNLLAFRERAEYPDDWKGEEAADVTGAEAYQRYAAVAIEHVMRRGGRLVVASRVDSVVVGGGADAWDEIAIVEYPNREAFLDMIADPDYLAATVHRSAALSRTALIATTAVVDASAAAPGSVQGA